MMSLFSSFDMYFFSGSSMVFLLLMVVLFNNSFKNGHPILMMKKFSSNLVEVIESFIPYQSSQFSLISILSIFLSFFLLNIYSVNSFNFPYGSQTSMVLLLGFSVWLSFNIFSVTKNYLGNLAHLIPEGAPIYMAMILMVIEFVSLVIRPITLSVRMMANILAGHLLMILLASLVTKFNLTGLLYVVLNMVEIFVAFIQSYIFTVMITLYYSDCK